MKRPKCDRCRGRLATHALRLVGTDGVGIMWSCSACWPQLEAVALETAAELGAVIS